MGVELRTPPEPHHGHGAGAARDAAAAAPAPPATPATPASPAASAATPSALAEGEQTSLTPGITITHELTVTVEFGDVPAGATPATPPGGATPATPPGGATPATPPGRATPATPPGRATPATPPGGDSPAPGQPETSPPVSSSGPPEAPPAMDSDEMRQTFEQFVATAKGVPSEVSAIIANAKNLALQAVFNMLDVAYARHCEAMRHQQEQDQHDAPVLAARETARAQRQAMSEFAQAVASGNADAAAEAGRRFAAAAATAQHPVSH